MIQNLEIILSLSGTILGLLITILTLILKFIKNTKAKKLAEQAVEVANIVLPFIKEAEKLTSYTGPEKKEFVMTKANQFAIKNNIPFNAKNVSEKIEELITLTKQVNAKNKTNVMTETNQTDNNKKINTVTGWL